jgi:hypothetical protein
MDRFELRLILARENIDPRVYTLDGGLPVERLCMEQREGGWVVYYSERGLRTGEQVFGTEDEACRNVLNQLRSDPTTRIR